VVASLPFPAGLPHDATGGEQTLLVVHCTHPVIERPARNMRVRQVVVHDACWAQGGRGITAPVPSEVGAGYGPRVTACLGKWSGRQRSRRRAVQEGCQSVWGVTIRQGAMPRCVRWPRRAGISMGWGPGGGGLVNPSRAVFKVQASRTRAALLVCQWPATGGPWI
jgi:hypothetical protein